MELGLKGKKAVITGARRGIGRSIAQLLADEGADLAISARGAEGLEAAAKDFESRGAKVFQRAFDVGDGDALKSFIEDSRRAWFDYSSGALLAVFPEGTYWLRVRFGVQCAGPLNRT